MKISAIIQARLNSERLPNKILLTLNKKPILFHVINRVSKITRLNSIVICMPKGNQANIIKKEIKSYMVKIKKKIHFFEGSEKNVYERTFESIKKYKIDVAVRITSDCPFIDPKTSSSLIKLFLDNKVKYARLDSNKGFPVGFDTEVIDTKLFYQKKKNTLSKFDLEHVTPFIWKNKDINTIILSSQPDFRNYRLVIDTKEDYQMASKLYSKLSKNFDYNELKKVLSTNKQLIKINANIKQKSMIGRNEK